MSQLILKIVQLVLLVFFAFWVQATNPDSAKVDFPNSNPDKNDKNNIVFYEGFEAGLQPTWTQEFLSYPDSFPAEWDVRTGAGIISPPGTIGVPDTAAVGVKNLVFQWQGIGHVTRIITPPIDLEFIINPVLSFSHAQAEWDIGEFDRLTIYYKKGDDGIWTLLQSYMYPVNEWVERSIPLPDSETDTYYFALEGVSGWGSGICIDEFRVEETGIIPKVLDDFTTDQASLEFIPTGSVNNPILKSIVRVTGNTGDLVLDSYSAKSLNTADEDITGLKLYYTSDEFFSTSHPAAIASGFENGTVLFENIGLNLPTGYSYLWLAYDVAENTIHGNTADAYIPAGGIVVNGENVLVEDQSPFGKRTLLESIYYDDFDTDKGWILTGEWERAVPKGLGGSYGHPGASYPFVGSNILGTDITGLGTIPGDYEPGLDTLENVAISNTIDCFYYKDVTLSFHRWLNVEPTDKVWIHISDDDGITWQLVWVNDNFFNTLGWNQRIYSLTGANRKSKVRVRFGLGPTDDTNNYSGWNIDNLVVTGTYVTQDVGVASWNGPNEGCGMSNQETIVVDVRNYGANDVTEPIPLGFSLDGGTTWLMDTLYQSILVGEAVIHTFLPKADFSIPGRYNDVLVKTFWSNDQDDTNDTLHHAVFSIPYITPPYSELFIDDDGLWTGYGDNKSWEWATADQETTYSGSNAWFTNVDGPYNSMEASWLESPCFNFTAVQHPVIEFFLHTHTLEGSDGLGIQYSTDKGVSWQNLAPWDETLSWGWHGKDTLPNLQNAFGSASGWHGSTEGWQRIRAVLGPEIAQQENVKFRLVFASGNLEEQTVLWEGVAFDAVSVYEAPHDIGVAALINPVDACELGTTQTVTISIENFGLKALPAGSQIPLALEVDTLQTIYEDFILANELAPGSSIQHTFESGIDMSAEGSHDIVSCTMLPGDTDFYHPGIYNDTLVASVMVYGYPDFSLGEDIYSLQPDTLLLDAGEGYVDYLWHDGTVDQTFQVVSPNSDFYSVRVTDANACTTIDTLGVIARDISVVAIRQPVSDCELSSEEFIIAQLQNTGTDPYTVGTVIPVKLFHNDVLYDEVIVTLAQEWWPGDTLQAGFLIPFDFSLPGNYSFTLVQTLKDAEPQNDTLMHTLSVYGYPQPYLGDTIYSQNPLEIILDGGAGYAVYAWQDNFDGQLYEITDSLTAWYSVFVADEHGCSGVDSVLLVTYDLDIVDVYTPLDACELSDQEQIGINIINHGPESFEPGRQFPFALHYNDGLVCEDTLVLDQLWLAGEEREFLFSARVDMQNIRSYGFKIFQQQRDANITNDSLDITLHVHGYPEIELPPYVTTDTPEMILLDPGAGHFAYEWQDGSTQPSYQAQTWGLHWVRVSNEFGCTSTDSTTIYPEVMDLALDNIVSPVSVCAETEQNTVVVEIENSGYLSLPEGTEIFLSYSINGEAEIMESVVLINELRPSSIREYIFTQTFDAPLNSINNIEVEVMFAEDEIDENNSLSQEFTINLLPQVSLGETIYSPNPVGIELTPGDYFKSYTWQDGSAEAIFTIQQPASQTYSVTITDETGCANTASVEVISYDLVMDSIVSPNSYCVLTENEEVQVKLFNQGYDDFNPGFSLQLGFVVADGSDFVMEDFVLEEVWPANTARYFRFQQSADLSAGNEFDFSAFIATPDVNNSTDTLLSYVQITGRPQVALGPDIYTTRLDTVVLNAGSGFASYYWHDGSNEPLYDVSSYGWKWVRVTDEYGCTGADTLYVGFFNNIYDTQAEFSSRVYPNPARENIHIELENLPAGGVRIEMTNMQGRLIKSKEINPDNNFRQSLEINNLPEGVYFLNIMGDGIRKTHKVTVVY